MLDRYSPASGHPQAPISSLLDGALSIAEFGKRFGLGRTTVYEEVRAGRLVRRKVGNRSLILLRDAEQWAQMLPETTS